MGGGWILDRRVFGVRQSTSVDGMQKDSPSLVVLGFDIYISIFLLEGKGRGVVEKRDIAPSSQHPWRTFDHGIFSAFVFVFCLFFSVQRCRQKKGVSL